jgi:hypothetical protein
VYASAEIWCAAADSALVEQQFAILSAVTFEKNIAVGGITSHELRIRKSDDVNSTADVHRQITAQFYEPLVGSSWAPWF